MYLLQADSLSGGQFFLYAAVAFVLNFLILYYVIKDAVSNANKRLEDKLQQLIDLKKGSTFSNNVSSNVNKHSELEELKRKLDLGSISKEVYLKRVAEIEEK